MLRKTPEGWAHLINRAIWAWGGLSAYPLDMHAVVRQFASAYVPTVKLDIVLENLDSLEGAMILARDERSATILLNDSQRYESRRNFTLAHEFGHFLCHRSVARQLRCLPDDIGRPHPLSGVAEGEANTFASQILLPPQLVRAAAERPFKFANIRQLTEQTGASLQASAITCVNLTGRLAGFAVVRDGFVRWGRASAKGLSGGLFFKSAMQVPDGSIAAFEGGERRELDENVSYEWNGSRLVETGFYSSTLDECYLFLDGGS